MKTRGPSRPLRRDAVVTPATVEARATIPTPGVDAQVLWDGVSLTFVGIVFAIVAAAAGVLVAPYFWWRWGYAVAVIVAAYFVLWRYRLGLIKLVQGRLVARA